MKRRLNLILNGKGGVGKSFLTVNLIEYLNDHSIKHVAIDTDNENSTLKRFYPDSVFVNLLQPSAIDQIFVELSRHSLVMVDCRAASTDIFLRFFNMRNAFDALEEFNASLTLVSPVSHDPDSVKQLQILVEQFNDKASYVVVKNRFFGAQFDIYDKSKTRARLLDELNGREIEMPMLDNRLVVALNQAATTITPALRSEKFFIVDRIRLKDWQWEFNEQIESAIDLLLPPKKSVKEKGAAYE